MEKKVLLLNSTYEPLKILTWQKAIMLYFGEKASIIESYSDFDLGTQKFTMPCPAVIVLRKYAKINNKKVTFSRSNIFSRDNYSCQYCIHPSHRILTADLRWVEAGSLQQGQNLVGFDENEEPSKRRRFKNSVIENFIEEKDFLYRVILDNSEEFLVTKEHKFLCRPYWGKYSWRTTDNLLGCDLPKHFNVWESESTFEAGWLSGMFDGEGWISGSSVCVAQNPGPVLSRIKAILNDRNFDFSEQVVNTGKDCVRLRINGGNSEYARLLGSFRPMRLLNNFSPESLGALTAKTSHKVVAVEPYGMGDIIKMKTSSSTFIADGYLHHNCGEQPGSNKLTFDHVLPRSRGGKTEWTNIVACCYPCNFKKADRTPQEAAMKLAKVPTHPATFSELSRAFKTSTSPAEWDAYLLTNP